MIHAACAKGGKVLLKWIWEGQCFYPSWRLEQNPDAHQWRKKSRRGCKETGIWCKRKSGGCQWDHPLCAWFLVVDLAVTSSHTKKPTFALQTQYLWKLGWRTAAAASPWKEQHSPWESARLLHFGDVCKILPSQPIYCAFLLGDSNSCTAHISTAFSWSLSRGVLTPLEGKDAFFALPKPTRICWWMFPPRPKSLFCRSFPKPQQEPLHHLLILRITA